MTGRMTDGAVTARIEMRDRKALSKRDAALYLGVSPDTIQRLTWARTLIPRYPTARPVYLVADLDKFIEACPDESEGKS